MSGEFNQILTRLAADSTVHTLPLALSLLSPCLAIPVGLGWFHVLKPAGSYAACGVTMFFVGMIFVVLLDVVELTLGVVLIRWMPEVESRSAEVATR